MTTNTRPNVAAADAKKIAITHDGGSEGIIALNIENNIALYIRPIGRDLLAIHFAHGVHPDTAQPDFHPERPHAIIAAHHLDRSPIWENLRNKPQLATILSVALAATSARPWPS